MDRKEIEKLIWTFFDASYARDLDGMAACFHQGSEYLGFNPDGTLEKMSGEAFIAGLRVLVADHPSPDYPRFNEILSIDFTGENAAVARTKIRVMNILYTDILCFMRLNGKWGIITKLASGVPI